MRSTARATNSDLIPSAGNHARNDLYRHLRRKSPALANPYQSRARGHRQLAQGAERPHHSRRVRIRSRGYDSRTWPGTSSPHSASRHDHGLVEGVPAQYSDSPFAAAAEKIAALDADITFRRAGWATEALAALDLYPVIQPWDTAYDLGPHDEHIQTHKSFASVWHAGKPVVATSDAFWSFNGGYNTYPHPGYAWGWQRRVLDRIGGLLEIGAMGSGDYHMALGMVGRYKASVPWV